MPVKPRPDETRRALLLDWLAGIELNADDIPADTEADTSDTQSTDQEDK